MLPFESVGGDTANTYFAQGLADELTSALARVPGLRVASSASAFTFASSGVDPQRVGSALHVDAVLQGRVRRAGERVRVVAQLTDASNGLLLWSNSYERQLSDVFAVQDELTGDIVSALRVTLVGGRSAPRPGAGTGTRSLEAYDLYLRGRFFLNQRGAGVERSIPYFQQAIALDSSFGRAWAQLGTAWALVPLFARVPLDSALPRARAAIDAALRLDSASTEAWAAAGLAAMGASDARAAVAAFERSIALDSSYATPHRPYMSALSMLGRTDDAVAQGRRAVVIDPLSPPTASVYSSILLTARRYDEAVAWARRSVELEPTTPLGWASLAMAELFTGQRDSAVAAVRRSPWIPNTLISMSYVIGATSGRDSVESLVRRLERERGTSCCVETAIGFAWLGAGDSTRALDALERAARAREPLAFQATFGQPGYDLVRGSARFAAVVRSYGLDDRLFTRRP